MRRGNQSNRFRPTLGTLENRECPTVNCVFNQGNLLVMGDQANNAVAIHSAAAGAVSVVGDGQSFSFQGVQSIRVLTGDGDDRVSIEVNEPSTPADAFGITATVDEGGGNDVFEFNLRSAAAPNFGPVANSAVIDVRATGSIGNDQLTANIGSAGGLVTLVPAVRVNLDGGAGDDTLRVGMRNAVMRKDTSVTMTGGDGADAVTQDFSANFIMAPLTVALGGGGGNDVINSRFDASGPRSVYNAPVSLRVTGDAGDDSINFALGGWEGTVPPTADGGTNSDPVVNSRFGVVLDGGDGADTIRATAKAAPQGAGSLTIQEFGGAGDDDLTLDLSAVPPTFTSSGFIDGGDGFDTHHSSPTVVVVNCEA